MVNEPWHVTFRSPSINWAFFVFPGKEVKLWSCTLLFHQPQHWCLVAYMRTSKNPLPSSIGGHLSSTHSVENSIEVLNNQQRNGMVFKMFVDISLWRNWWAIRSESTFKIHFSLLRNCRLAIRFFFVTTKELLWPVHIYIELDRKLHDKYATVAYSDTALPYEDLSCRPRKALWLGSRLGLINDLQAAHTTFPAAPLSWVWVLSFVCLFTPINDHIIIFVIPLIVCRDSSSDTRGCILEPEFLQAMRWCMTVMCF